VSEANVGVPAEDWATVEEYIESELVNLITLRDVAELEGSLPAFSRAVEVWLAEIRGERS
jgi:hypothetical protein